MRRVGYDSDSGKYYYKDRDGSLWEGAEGAEFGELRQGQSLSGLTSPYLNEFDWH